MRWSLSALVTLSAAGVLAAPAVAQAPQPGERIAPGMSAGGVDLSGLSVAQAAAKLNTTVRPALERVVVVQRAGKTFRLTPKGSKLTFDETTTAKRALYAGRARPAGSPPAEVALAARHSTAAVRRFAGRVDRKLSITGRDSRLLISPRKVRVTRSRSGRDIDSKALASQIDTALALPTTPRVFKPALVRTRARRNYQDMRKRASTVVTVDKSARKLRLFKNLKVVKTYRVAVGQPAYPTPSGLFTVQSKQVNPVWSVPNSPWAGELGGTTVNGGSAENPLKARWIGVSGSVGIHGTGETGSLGTAASHGCVRMAVGDVIALFRRVSVGTPVLLAR